VRRIERERTHFRPAVRDTTFIAVKVPTGQAVEIVAAFHEHKGRYGSSAFAATSSRA
jgi:hypothetical protein